MKLKEEMERIFNFEQMRIIAVSIISPVIAITTPIKGFIWSLVVMFAFNIFAGFTFAYSAYNSAIRRRVWKR